MRKKYAPCSLDVLVSNLKRIKLDKHIQDLIDRAKSRSFKFDKNTRIEIKVMNEEKMT